MPEGAALSPALPPPYYGLIGGESQGLRVFLEVCQLCVRARMAECLCSQILPHTFLRRRAGWVFTYDGTDAANIINRARQPYVRLPILLGIIEESHAVSYQQPG